MKNDLFRDGLQKNAKVFNQKISLVVGPLAVELLVHDEQAVGQVFDHFPLAQLVQDRMADYKVEWVNSQLYGFSTSEWREEIDQHYQVPGESAQKIYLKPNFIAMVEGERISLIASYEIAAGFLDFIKWLETFQPAP